MAACMITALPGGATGWSLQLEELEVDADVLARGGAERFILACGGTDAIFGQGHADNITPGSGVDTVDAGSGNDRVNSRDSAADMIDCGAGRDRATVDRADTVTNCETVSRK